MKCSVQVPLKVILKFEFRLSKTLKEKKPNNIQGLGLEQWLQTTTTSRALSDNQQNDRGHKDFWEPP